MCGDACAARRVQPGQGPILLCSRYAMSSTDVGYRPMPLAHHIRYWSRSTYAMSGTDVGLSATPSLVLSAAPHAVLILTSGVVLQTGASEVVGGYVPGQVPYLPTDQLRDARY